jgi:hypothetical protein
MEGSWLELLDSDGRDKMAVEAEEKNEDTGIRFFVRSCASQRGVPDTVFLSICMGQLNRFL